jgi:uncharacterized membrane protein
VSDADAPADARAARRRGPAWLGAVNETLRFVCEVALVAVAGWWGWATPNETWVSVVLVVALPLAVVVVWGMFGAPRRPMYPHSRWLPTFVLLFLTALAVLALIDLGQPELAAVLAVLVVVTDIGVQLGVHTSFRPTRPDPAG